MFKITLIVDRKKELREKIRQLKAQYSKSELLSKSRIISNKIENHSAFLRAEIIMFYWSMADEVYTHDFLNKWYREKTILLPCVNGDNLELRKFEGEDKMVTGESFSIKEPVGEVFTNIEQIDIILVPGVAFDKSNNRLGRGKAYYDKLLNDYRGRKTGVCFDFQMVEQVPVDAHDVKMDDVIYG